MKLSQPKPKKDTKKTGAVGEGLAVKYLQQQGYTILNTNYWKKWGELDIVTKKGDQVHFIEVKTVSYETKKDLEWAVTHETWRPEELVTHRKLRQIEKALETWISENKYPGEWQIDVVTVRIVPRETYCTVNLLKNVTFG